MKNVKRENWIDLLKFFGIFFVVAGHLVKMHSFFTNYIFSFHMPLFFFISGYLLGEKSSSFKNFIRQKARILLIPYFFISLVGLLFTYAQTRSISLVKIGLEVFVGGEPESIHAGQIWFLICLFFTEIIYFMIRTKIKEEKRKVALIVFLAVLGLIWSKYFAQLYFLPLKLGSVFTALSFYATGNILKKGGFKFSYTNKYLFYFVVLFSFVGTILFGPTLNGSVNLSTLTFNNIIYYYLAAFSGIIFYGSIAKEMITDKYLEFFGRNSLIIFTTHSFVMLAIILVTNQITQNNFHIFSFNLTLGLYFTMLTLLAEIPIIYFSRKYFAPFFGLESPPGYAPLRATEADIEGLKSQLGLDLESKISPEKEVIIK